MMQLEAELLQEQKEEGGERRDQPAHGVRVEENELPRGKVAENGGTNPHMAYELKRMNSPAARSRRGILPALIFLAFSGEVHPTKRRTRSSWAWLWKRRRKGSEDMAMNAAMAGDGSQGSRKAKGCRAQGSRSQGMCGDEGALQRLLMARAKR
jgi:hypothetical protein